MIPGGDTQEAVRQVRDRAQQDHQGPVPADRTGARAVGASCIDITGDKMKLLLDFPTIGEPHYAQAIDASLIKDKQVKFFKLAENKHPYVTQVRKRDERRRATARRCTCT